MAPEPSAPQETMLRIWEDPDGGEWTVTMGYETEKDEGGDKEVRVTRVRFRRVGGEGGGEPEDVVMVTRRRIGTLSLLSDEELFFLLDRARRESGG